MNLNENEPEKEKSWTCFDDAALELLTIYHFENLIHFSKSSSTARQIMAKNLINNSLTIHFIYQNRKKNKKSQKLIKVSKLKASFYLITQC